MNFLSKEEVEYYRKRYPIGSRIVLEYMEDAYAVEPGTRGTVRCVDDVGTIHVIWDNGRRLGVVPKVDSFGPCVD